MTYSWRGKPEYFDKAMDAVKKGSPDGLKDAIKNVRGGSNITHIHENGDTLATIAVKHINYHCRLLHSYYNGDVKVNETEKLQSIDKYNQILHIVICKFKKWKTTTNTDGKTPIDLIKENPFFTGDDKPLHKMVSVPQKLTI